MTHETDQSDRIRAKRVGGREGEAEIEIDGRETEGEVAGTEKSQRERQVEGR